jgi:hypothetical protein
MAGSSSVAVTVALSAKVAVVDSCEVRRSPVYMRYISGSRALPWSTPTFRGESSVYSYSTLTLKCLLCR